MNHYLFKYAVEKAKESFLNKRVSSVGVHTNTLISFAFQKSDSFLFADLSPQNSFFMPFHKSYNRRERNDIPFFYFLRKNLVGLKLIDIVQTGSERIVYLIFEDARGSIINRYKLVFEIMDRNTNAIFTDENDVILQAFKYVDTPNRTIIPKKRYVPLGSEMPDLLSSDMDILVKKYKFREDILGFSVHLRKLVSSEGDFVELVKKIREIFGSKTFALYLYPKDVVLPFYFRKAIREVDEDFLFDQLIIKRVRIEFENKKKNVLKILKKRLNSLSRRLHKVEAELNTAENYEKYKIFAENLMAHPNIDTAYLSSVEVEDVYTYKPIIIPLNPKLSLFENAQYYFKKYKKAKKSVDLVKKRIDETQNEILFVKQLIFDVERSLTDEELDYVINILIKEKIVKSTQKTKQIKGFLPYEKIKIKDFDAYIGKNAHGNDIVTLKLSSKHDLWFHAKNRPSSHLVLKLPVKLKRLDDDVIIIAAKEVAKRTKAEQCEKIDIDYAFVKDVKKPKGLKPGLVLYKNFKTVTVKKGECS